MAIIDLCSRVSAIPLEYLDTDLTRLGPLTRSDQTIEGLDIANQIDNKIKSNMMQPAAIINRRSTGTESVGTEATRSGIISPHQMSEMSVDTL